MNWRDIESTNIIKIIIFNNIFIGVTDVKIFNEVLLKGREIFIIIYEQRESEGKKRQSVKT